MKTEKQKISTNAKKDLINKKDFWKCPFCNKRIAAKGKGGHLKIHGYKIDYIQLIGLR